MEDQRSSTRRRGREACPETSLSGDLDEPPATAASVSYFLLFLLRPQGAQTSVRSLVRGPRESSSCPDRWRVSEGGLPGRTCFRPLLSERAIPPPPYQSSPASPLILRGGRRLRNRFCGALPLVLGSAIFYARSPSLAAFASSETTRAWCTIPCPGPLRRTIG